MIEIIDRIFMIFFGTIIGFIFHDLIENKKEKWLKEKITKN